MSKPRGGRGGERGRGARGGNTSSNNPFLRGAAGQGRDNGAPAQSVAHGPTHDVFTRGGFRGGHRGGAGRGHGNAFAPRGNSNSNSNNAGGRGNHV
jgi:hypothetical protein